jgi:hypothetical protein
MNWVDDPLRRSAHRRAVAHQGKGQRELWASCFACARIVGKYDKGASLALADDLHSSVDTVESRAHAAEAWALMRAAFRGDSESFTRLKAVRAVLGYSYFVVVWKRIRAEDDAYDILADLEVSASGGGGTRAFDRATRKRAAVSFPVVDLTSKTIWDMIDRQGRKARVVILPDDYTESTADVMMRQA